MTNTMMIDNLSECPDLDAGVKFASAYESRSAKIKSNNRHSIKIFLIGFLSIIGCGLVLWPFIPHRYEAIATIILRSRDDSGSVDHALALRQALDDGAVQSELDVISSLPLTQKIMNDFELANDPELAPSQPPFFVRSLERVGIIAANASQDPSSKLQDHLIVSRDKRSYTIKIGFWSSNPEKAARWANALVSAYFERQIEGRRNEADRRVERIRTQMLELAERAYDLRYLASLEGTDETAKAALSDQRTSVIDEFAKTRKTLIDTLQLLPHMGADAELVAEAVPPKSYSFPNPLLMSLAVLCLASLGGLGLMWGLSGSFSNDGDGRGRVGAVAHDD